MKNTEDFWRKRPFIIAGPCSAETPEQLIQTAKNMPQQVNMLRAGIWKPRTQPNVFEGIGEPALAWLTEAKKASNLPTAIEVASAQHVEMALKNKVDLLWIGARTTVSPFAVQEIADALKGVDIPILVKNPVNPDVKLWQGAIERIQKAGIQKVGAILRGFSSENNENYRNIPMWHLAIQLKTYLPTLLLLCDPSHICGKTTNLQEVAQISIDLGFDGLMIETHIDPKNAWTDAAQQITPKELNTLLQNLNWKKNDVVAQELLLLREKINHLDNELIHLLTQRMKVVEKIGEYKKENQIRVLQVNRWQEVLRTSLKQAQKVGLDINFVKQIMEMIHIKSVEIQDKIIHKNKK